MNYIQALILGIVQGLTEFLPVSSSTHLAFAKRLMGIENGEGLVYFDLLCHLGTLGAVLIALRKDLWKTLTDLRSTLLLLLALVPLVPVYFFLKPLRPLLADWAGLFLLFTSALLFFSSAKTSPPIPSPSKWRDMLCIGLAQSLALLPGISRSGSTMAVGRLLGWEWSKAARFSFLLAIPTILGGVFIETLHGVPEKISWSLCLVGCVTSFAVGLGSLRLLFWILNRNTLKPFAWYCLAVGLWALIW